MRKKQQVKKLLVWTKIKSIEVMKTFLWYKVDKFELFLGYVMNSSATTEVKVARLV